MKTKLKELLLHKDKETRLLGQEMYKTIKEPTQDLVELYAESLLIGQGLFEQLKQSNIHIYDPSRFSTIEISN